MKKLLVLTLVLNVFLAKAQTTCNTTAIFANESSNAVCIDTAGAVRYAYSNNYPDHSDNYNQPQFTTTAGDYTYYMCAHPDTAADFTPLYEEVETTVGCTYNYKFGVSINGVKYDPNSAVTFQNTSTGENNVNWHEEAASTTNQIGQNMGTLNGGHLNPFGEYHYHAIPTDYFVNDLGIDGSSHSPIVGYAADGFPIYYKYVYQDPENAGTVVALSSGYSLKSGQRPGDGVSAPDGAYDGNYYEDYEYTLTDLDECNGRYGVTPDYPYGTYYYVLTDNYPYIPRCFKGTYVDHSFRVGPGPSCPNSTASTSCAAAVYGCMDPFATNYDANANVDNGNCQYVVTSVEDESQNLFAIYPNPTDGVFQVTSERPETVGVAIFDAQGREILRDNIQTTVAAFDLSSFAKGAYTVVFSSDQKILNTRQVVIR
ncbi:MAG: YHYH protein [Flavobacteriales bacterium]|nr:YHYH protein [Flavobacteriales bacterium]